ncbi:hypothetical protein GQ457_02G012550 [Hibiscus cannabinus]
MRSFNRLELTNNRATERKIHAEKLRGANFAEKPSLFVLDIEVDMKNNEEQDEEQSKEYRMHKNGGRACLHVHKINGVMLPGDLQQQTR